MNASYAATQPEIELMPAAASPLNTVAMAESMHRKYNLATPVSGTLTARMHLREFQRTAQLMLEAKADMDTCPDCRWSIDGFWLHVCERHL